METVQVCTKCQCTEVEKERLAFGIVNLIVTLLTFLATIMFGLVIAGFLIYPVLYSYSVMVGMACLMGLIFTIMLCDRKPGRMKVYVVYGVVVSVLGVAAGIAFWATSDYWSRVYIFIGCVINSLLLVMVHRTYFKLILDDSTNGVKSQEQSDPAISLEVPQEENNSEEVALQKPVDISV